MGLFRPSVEFAVRVVGELARAEGECVLRTEDEYCKHTRFHTNCVYFLYYPVPFFNYFETIFGIRIEPNLTGQDLFF